jgi:hypothetical protein
MSETAAEWMHDISIGQIAERAEMVNVDCDLVGEPAGFAPICCSPDMAPICRSPIFCASWRGIARA